MKLPHSLRLVIFLLRFALGLNFFYLGFTVLFNPPLGRELAGRSMSDLYSWLGTANASAPWIHPVAAWAFLIIGIVLMIGLFTRLASIAAIVFVLLSYLPGVSFSTADPALFIKDGLIVTICLLVLIFGDAGSYLGLDKFIHFRLFGNGKKKV